MPLSRKADSALTVSVACMPTKFSAQREQGDVPKPCSSRAVRKKKKECVVDLFTPGFTDVFESKSYFMGY